MHTNLYIEENKNKNTKLLSKVKDVIKQQESVAPCLNFIMINMHYFGVIM